jgi:hypothetical protein
MRFLKGLVLAFALAFSCASHAQDPVNPGLLYAWPEPTGTGQLGKYVILATQIDTAPSNYSIDWSISGAAPSVCTFRVEGSFDNVNWFGLDTTSPASTSCTTSNMESIAYKPVYFIRVNIVTWTAGAGTITFHLTGHK